MQSPFLFFFFHQNTFSALRRKWQVVRFFSFTQNLNLLLVGEEAGSKNLLKAAQLRENKVVIKKTYYMYSQYILCPSAPHYLPLAPEQPFVLFCKRMTSLID